jgi:hypothetical protein
MSISAWQHVSTPPGFARRLVSIQLVSVVADGEEMICSKKRFMKRVIRGRTRAATRYLKA